jgi:hypothetical protein
MVGGLAGWLGHLQPGFYSPKPKPEIQETKPNPDKPEPKTFKGLPQRHKGHQGTPRNIFLFVNLCVLCVLVVNFLPTEHGKAGTKRFLANFLPEKARILEISY